jgi:hypothetical protein
VDVDYLSTIAADALVVSCQTKPTLLSNEGLRIQPGYASGGYLPTPPYDVTGVTHLTVVSL